VPLDRLVGPPVADPDGGRHAIAVAMVERIDVLGVTD